MAINDKTNLLRFSNNHNFIIPNTKQTLHSNPNFLKTKHRSITKKLFTPQLTIRNQSNIVLIEQIKTNSNDNNTTITF